MTPDEVCALATASARRLTRLADGLAGSDIRFEYSPETFNVTEPWLALEIADRVAEVVEACPDRPLVLNLPSTVETHRPSVFADQIEWMDRNLARRESIILSVHPHNDRGTAVAAAELALAAGADRVEGTLFGNGERTGNVCLVTLALNLFSDGVDPQLDLSDIAAVRATVEECNEMPVHPRHPYAGDLVFTAFSGTHQDAVAKGLAHLDARAAAEGRPAGELPWDVPYLPIDPRDVGRSYEAIIRVNSQSGKGGVAHVLNAGWGMTLPDEMRAEVAGVIQGIVDGHGREIGPDEVWRAFREAFCVRDGDGWGDDGGPAIDALLETVRTRGVPVEVERLVDDAAGTATGAARASYARVMVGRRPVWGVGLGGTTGSARVGAVRAALARAGADARADGAG
jgi:2-isopropylmalate synthase